MFKEAVRTLETGVLPQIGLVAFVVAFACVVVYAFTLSRTQRSHLAALPLDDGTPADAAGPLPRHAGDGAPAPALLASSPSPTR